MDDDGCFEGADDEGEEEEGEEEVVLVLVEDDVVAAAADVGFVVEGEDEENPVEERWG